MNAPNQNNANGMRDKCILELLYSAVLRISELLNIKVNQILPEQPFLKIRGKGNKERLVPIGSFAMNLLITYIDTYRSKFKANNNIDMLFITENGNLITRQSCWEMIKNMLENQ